MLDEVNVEIDEVLLVKDDLLASYHDDFIIHVLIVELVVINMVNF